jgi:peptidoglycan/LPS O-acetylase OafA/YrhL
MSTCRTCNVFQCLTHTHQLAVDMQLYVVAPIFVYLLWSRRWLGLGTLILCGVYSTHLRYITTFNRKLSTVVYFGTPYVYGLLASFKI